MNEEPIPFCLGRAGSGGLPSEQVCNRCTEQTLFLEHDCFNSLGFCFVKKKRGLSFIVPCSIPIIHDVGNLDIVFPSCTNDLHCVSVLMGSGFGASRRMRRTLGLELGAGEGFIEGTKSQKWAAHRKMTADHWSISAQQPGWDRPRWILRPSSWCARTPSRPV